MNSSIVALRAEHNFFAGRSQVHTTDIALHRIALHYIALQYIPLYTLDRIT